MAKMVAHMARMKKGNMSGIEGHNKRLFKNHSNKDIDISKSYLNYDLVPCNGSYLDAFNNEMDRYYTGKKAPRKDAVLCNEWIFSASSDFFQNLSADDEKRFFESCLDFMRERYGHVIYAVVHRDETTPHMHLGLVPLTQDGRLSNKSIFTRTELKSLHSDLYKHLTSQGFVLEPPQPNNKKHLSIMDFKIAKRQEHLDKQNEAIAKNAVVLNNQQTQYKATQLNLDKKKKEILADINKREKDLEKREKDIEKRDEEVSRKEDDYRNKYNKSIKLVKQATAIEKRLDDKIAMYQRLESTKYDSAYIQALRVTLEGMYGKSQTEQIFDTARDNLDAINYVDTQALDDYKLFKKQTVKSKQVDDLEI